MYPVIPLQWGSFIYNSFSYGLMGSLFLIVCKKIRPDFMSSRIPALRAGFNS